MSETDDIPLDEATQALPSEEELNSETPILAGLFGGANQDQTGNPVATSDETASAPASRRSGFGAFGGVRQGPDAQDVPLGTILPFGQIARVCDAKGQKLGQLVEKAASRGARYRLYDSAPNQTGPRTFYVKGFKDNCPRQFTASLALFGSPEMHEQLRYGLPAKDIPYSATDKAYETVKSQVCGVARSKPCGRRISRLEQTTVFVSAYENFSENARWADMLLHEGKVEAASLKRP